MKLDARLYCEMFDYWVVQHEASRSIGRDYSFACSPLLGLVAALIFFFLADSTNVQVPVQLCCIRVCFRHCGGCDNTDGVSQGRGEAECDDIHAGRAKSCLVSSSNFYHDVLCHNFFCTLFSRSLFS